MKKFLSIALAMAMALSLTACGGDNGGDTPNNSAGNTSGSGAAGSKVVKIGVFEPQSGDNGAGGKQEILGMQYANQETPTVEIDGETYTVELVYADNQSSNDKAPSAAQTLVAGGVSIVLGSYGSGVSIAASDTFGDAGVPAVGVTCTTVLANFAKDKFSATKAYCLAKQGDDYSVGLCNYFMEAFGKDNCVYETFPEGTSDYSSYVTNAKNSGAQVFFAPVSTEAAALIIDQASTQSLGMPILAGDTWDSNVVTAAAKGKDVDINVTTFYQEGGNPEFDAGIKEWINGDSAALANNGGNDEVAAVTIMGYDAYYVALEALKAAKSTDPSAVMAVLGDVEYDGVSGHIVFDDVNGDAIRDVAYVKHCNTETGLWELVAQQGV